MKAKPSEKRTLKLQRETLTQLSRPTLREIAGGIRCVSSESNGQCSGQVTCH